MIARLKYFWRMRSEQFKSHVITTSLVTTVIGGILLVAEFPALMMFLMPAIALVAIYCMVYNIIKSIRE